MLFQCEIDQEEYVITNHLVHKSASPSQPSYLFIDQILS